MAGSDGNVGGPRFGKRGYLGIHPVNLVHLEDPSNAVAV